MQYQRIFDRIYTCAKHNKFDTVVMPFVGATDLARYYEPKKRLHVYESNEHAFRREIWYPAFRDVVLRGDGSGKGIITKFAGTHLFQSEIFEKFGNKFIDIGYFPANTARVNCDKTLFVNAWDPASLPGNGNCNDSSLHSFGCFTTIAVTGTSITNPWIQYSKIEFPYAL